MHHPKGPLLYQQQQTPLPLPQHRIVRITLDFLGGGDEGEHRVEDDNPVHLNRAGPAEVHE